jgi:isopropylmalate/homocitrate/citramalate synthase
MLKMSLRSDPLFLKQVFEHVIEAGATVVTVSDTVGCATPWRYGELITFVKQKCQKYRSGKAKYPLS